MVADSRIASKCKVRRRFRQGRWLVQALLFFTSTGLVNVPVSQVHMTGPGTCWRARNMIVWNILFILVVGKSLWRTSTYLLHANRCLRYVVYFLRIPSWRPALMHSLYVARRHVFNQTARPVLVHQIHHHHRRAILVHQIHHHQRGLLVRFRILIRHSALPLDHRSGLRVRKLE